MTPNLHSYSFVLVNSSAGKDSQTALAEVSRLAEAQSYPRDRIHVVHADLGDEEWGGVPDLARRQAEFHGFQFHITARRKRDGSSDSILAYTLRRGKWPSSTTRWCTSDFKRGPCRRILTSLSRQYRNAYGVHVLQVFGFRAEESPMRAKKEPFSFNQQCSNKTRRVYDWLPIHDWTEDEVWKDIHASGVPYHPAYDLGMPRLSCCFCIFAPRAALMIAGRARPELLDRYVDVEKQTGHSFRVNLSLTEIRSDIAAGVQAGNDELTGNWNM